MELNAEQTKQALECCSVAERHSCYYCSYHKQAYCRERLSQNTLALILAYEEQIQKLTEENERLMIECGNQSTLWRQHFESIYETAKETVRADTVREIQTRFSVHFGTYTDKDMTPIIDVFRLLDQIAQEILEGK